MVVYILPSMAKALLGLFCYAPTFGQTPQSYIALSSRYKKQGERSRGISFYACCGSFKYRQFYSAFALASWKRSHL